MPETLEDMDGPGSREMLAVTEVSEDKVRLLEEDIAHNEKMGVEVI